MFARASSTLFSSARNTVSLFPPFPLPPSIESHHLIHSLQSTRGYATATRSGGISSTAPYFLGAGLAGSLAFYYSTSSQRSLLAESSQSTQSSKKESALNPDEFRSFKLSKVIPYNHNSSRFVFDLPEGTDSGLNVASALVVKAAKEGEALGKNGKPVVRPYTPTTAPNVEGKLVCLFLSTPSLRIHELIV